MVFLPSLYLSRSLCICISLFFFLLNYFIIVVFNALSVLCVVWPLSLPLSLLSFQIPADLSGSMNERRNARFSSDAPGCDAIAQ